MTKYSKVPLRFSARLRVWPKTSIPRVEMHRPARESPAAVEGKLPLRALLQPHIGPVVRQMIVGARHGYGQQVAGVERKAIDARRAGKLVANIGAQIQVGEAARSGNRRHAANLDAVKPEGHHAEPGRTLKRVHLKPIGQAMPPFAPRESANAQTEDRSSAGSSPSGPRVVVVACATS